MAPVTEFAIFQVKSGVDVSDPSNDGAKILQDALNVVMAQPGAQRAYFSPEIEQPTNVRLFVDWEDVQNHIAFTKSADYGPMMKTLAPLIDGESLIRHFTPDPFPPRSVLTSDGGSVTEVITVHYPASVSKSAQDAMLSRFKELEKNALTDCPDFRGASGGLSLEDDIPDPKKSAEKGKVFIGLVGWTSVEAHMKFRETKIFAENIHLLRDAPEQNSLSVYHVKCQQVSAGSTGAPLPVQDEILNP